MDGVLDLLDEYLLDDVYAKLIPVGLFTDPSAPASSPFASLLSSTPSTWASIAKSLPHPPISALASNATLSSAASVANISAWPRDYLPRQILSLSVFTLIGIHLLYFIFAGMSYYVIFNHEMMRHPRFLKNQVRLEIISSLQAFPVITVLTLPFFLGEVRGYSFLYGDVSDFGWFYFFASIPMYLLFTDYLIYWIHRLLHHPILYKRLHKPHHKWLIPTPFASHAFHPVDGWLQSVPYHLYIFIFPIQRWLYMGLFVAVNFWSIFIHDSDMITGHPLESIINGPAHHTLHHLYFTCNYGQYFTWADKKYNSYRQPEPALDPLLEIKALEQESKKSK